MPIPGSSLKAKMIMPGKMSLHSAEQNHKQPRQQLGDCDESEHGREHDWLLFLASENTINLTSEKEKEKGKGKKKKKKGKEKKRKSFYASMLDKTISPTSAPPNQNLIVLQANAKEFCTS